MLSLRCQERRPLALTASLGNFFMRCWSIVKEDLLAALNQVHALDGDLWRLINTANLVLLPKKDGAANAKDFRPVSLMHSVSKICCKLLANRLAPELQKLVSNN